MSEIISQPKEPLKFVSDPVYIQTPTINAQDKDSKAAEADGVPLSIAKEYSWAKDIVTKASTLRFDNANYPSRVNIARAMDEMTRAEILKSEVLRDELEGLKGEAEVRKFFEEQKVKKFKKAHFLKPEQDYSHTNLIGMASGRTRVVPLMNVETEMFVSPFISGDFDPSKLSDQELLMLSRVKVPVSDVQFVPSKYGSDLNGDLIEIPTGDPQNTRPTKEQAKFYQLVEAKPKMQPLLKMLAPENYERALQEAEKRAGATRELYAANSVASGLIPFGAFGTARPKGKEELFQEMLDPNFETRETVAAIGGLLTGGYTVASKASKLVDKGWKTRNVVIAGALGEGALGVGYQHAAPGLLATYMGKPDNSLLNFTEAATIAGSVGLGFSFIQKLRNHKSGKFKDEVEAMGKATTKEEVEAIRAQIIKKLESEPDTVPASVKNGKIINVVTGENPAKSPSWFKKWLSADKGVDPAIQQRVRQRDAAIAARVNVEMKADVAKLQSAVKKAGGLSDEMLEGINEGIRTGIGIGHLPDEVANAVKTLFDKKRALSGAIKTYMPKNLRAVFDKNMDLYLHRSYQIHDDPNWVKTLKNKKGEIDESNPLVRDAMDWFSNELRATKEASIISNAVENNKRVPTGEELEALIDKAVKETGSDENLLGQVEALLESHSPEKWKGAMGSKEDILKQRKLDPVKDAAIMKLLGEHTDPFVNYTKSISKMSGLLEHIKFAEDMHTAGTGQWVFKDPKPNFAVKIPDAPRFGSMAGKYTSRHISDIMNEVDGMFDLGAAGRYMIGVNAAVNWTKVVPSHVAQFRNVQGGLIMNMAAGRVTPKGGVQAFSDFWNSISGLKNTENTSRLKKYAEMGLLDENIDISYINEFVKDKNTSTFIKRIFNQDPSAVSGQLKGLESLGKASVGKMNEVYQGVDNMMRIYGYEQELTALKKAFPKMDSKAKMPSEFWPDNISGTMEEYAARITTNTYPTYSRIPNAVVAWRRLGVFGNFMSFQSEMFRTSKNIIKQGLDEVNSGNPELKARGVKRLAAFTSIALVGPKAAETIGNAHYGTPSERVNAARTFLPPWAKNSRVIITNNNPNKFTYIDLGYTHPYTFAQEPLLHFAVTGKMPEATWGDTVAKMLSPFMDERILLKHGIDVLRGQDEYGRPVEWYEGLAKAFEPGEFATLKRLWESKQPGVRGRDESAELWNNAIAVRPTTVQMTGNKGQLEYKARDYQNSRSAAAREFSSIVTAKVPASAEQQLNAFRKMNEEAFKAQQILYSQIKAAEDWGVKPKDIQQSMGLGNISMEMWSNLRRGRFTTVGFSMDMVKRELMDKRPIARREMNRMQSNLHRKKLSLEPDVVFPTE